MKAELISDIAAWLTEAGLAGVSENAIVDGFCERCNAAGLPVARAHVFIDTLHPVHEGRLLRWGHSANELALQEYGRTGPLADGGAPEDALAAERWRKSPFYRMLQTGESLLRRRVTTETAIEFAALAEIREFGMTDYLAIINRFASDGAIGEMDCLYSSWATRNPGGFSDLRGFTRITDTAPEQVMPLLNDYADVIVSAIHEHGGDVLKLIGDGTLAIFAADDRERACNAALAAAIAAQQDIAELNRQRSARGLPVTEMYLGLHAGKVFYGNVGGRERLDFTVIGPAVNETSRIAAMCRSVDQPVLTSAAFADIGNNRRRLISVGRYALRGVAQPQELFTFDPEA